MCSLKVNTSIIQGQQIISEKPSREQAAKNCNDNYHSLFEQATDAIMVTDFSGNFTDVNAALCTMFGYTKEELLQLNVKALLDEEALKIHPVRFDLLAAGENIFNERKMLHKNGTVIYVEANAKKLMDNRIMVIARDITERKKADWILQKSEANLHTIFDTTDTKYVLMDNDFRIISYNDRAYAFVKKELGHCMEVGGYLPEYFPLAEQPALLIAMREVLAGKRISYEVNYPQPEGSFNWYHLRLLPISKGDNNVYGLMMAVSSITEKIVLQQKLEEERIKKQQEITEAVITAEENERQEIGRELHDNVNQILVSSRLYLCLAKKYELKEDHPLIDKMEQLIEMAIDELRNLSHSFISPFQEDTGLTEALDYLIETISRSGSIIIKKDAAAFSEHAVSEKLRLTIYRIVQEQFNNILKYARAKTVFLKLVREDEKITLSIKDDGVGFDPAVKSKGIGFMNIRTRASLFNGVVSIISSPGNGCELTVSLNEN
jgi:PAS domain S-box-containing protein